MARKYAFFDEQAVYFVTFTVVNWLDVFTRDVYREIIVDSLEYCRENKGLEVFAYCLMTNHIHLIVRAKAGYKLSDIIRDFKRHTSTYIKDAIKKNAQESRKTWLMWMLESAGERNSRNNSFQLWQQHSHPIILDSEQMFNQRLDYLHNNPLVAGFVDDPTNWLWSSAKSYELGVKGVLELDDIE